MLLLFVDFLVLIHQIQDPFVVLLQVVLLYDDGDQPDKQLEVYLVVLVALSDTLQVLLCLVL